MPTPLGASVHPSARPLSLSARGCTALPPPPTSTHARVPRPGLSERAQTIATYALCCFGNLGSMGIMVGCLSGMVPRIRTAVTRDVFRALLAGNIACFSTACVASAILADAGSEAPSQYECPCFKSECPAP